MDRVVWGSGGVGVVSSCLYISYWESGYSCFMSWSPVGCPDIFERCQFEQHCSCRWKGSLEKSLGNENFLQIVVGFRTKPRTLGINHICPFIVTVQTLTTGKTVSSTLTATWSGGRETCVVILVSPASPWALRRRRDDLAPMHAAGCAAVDLWVGLRGWVPEVPSTPGRLFRVPSHVPTVTMMVCDNSTNNV